MVCMAKTIEDLRQSRVFSDTPQTNKQLILKVMQKKIEGTSYIIVFLLLLIIFDSSASGSVVGHHRCGHGHECHKKGGGGEQKPA